MVIGTSYTRNWDEKSYNGNSSKTEGVRFADLVENQKNAAVEKIDVTKNTNQYFKLANENGIIEYGGTKLICDRVIFCD